MTLIDDMEATNDVALAVASALEQVLGDDVILAVGVAQRQAPTPDLLPAGATRAVSLEVGDGIAGEIALVVSDQLGTSLEARAADELLTSSVTAALEAGATALSGLVTEEVRLGRTAEVGTDTVVADDGSDFVVYPLSADDERVACLVVKLAAATASVALHEFDTLSDGATAFGGSRPLAILKDVEMGVTAELGRRRMTVRDLLALTPGSVIELDRAAGSPVDVLVNGTLIARGEVVVIDEEFGIRIAEIVAAEPMGRGLMSSGATLALFGRLIISLGFVIGLMWFAARVVRRRGLGGATGANRRPGVSVDVLARRTLGRNASIAVVRTGNQAMVIGVTDHMVTKLADTDLDAIELQDAGSQWTAPSQGPPGPTPSWKAMLDLLRDRTART